MIRLEEYILVLKSPRLSKEAWDTLDKARHEFYQGNYTVGDESLNKGNPYLDGDTKIGYLKRVWDDKTDIVISEEFIEE